jgi:hypothetical protein
MKKALMSVMLLASFLEAIAMEDGVELTQLCKSTEQEKSAKDKQKKSTNIFFECIGCCYARSNNCLRYREISDLDKKREELENNFWQNYKTNGLKINLDFFKKENCKIQ